MTICGSISIDFLQLFHWDSLRPQGAWMPCWKSVFQYARERYVVGCHVWWKWENWFYKKGVWHTFLADLCNNSVNSNLMETNCTNQLFQFLSIRKTGLVLCWCNYSQMNVLEVFIVDEVKARCWECSFKAL